MKKSLLSVVLLILTFTMLFSCKIRKDDSDAGLSGNENYIFAEGSRVNVVCNTSTDNAVRIANLVGDAIDMQVSLIPDAEAVGTHEIILGKTNRELSKKAYNALERIREDDGDNVAYLIYTDGKSVALAYDVDIFELNVAEERAVEYFINTVIGDKTELVLSAGVVASLAFDPIEYQEEFEDKIQEEKWAEFETKLSAIADNYKEIADAYRYYYSAVCTDDVVYWLADLYDKDKGGFYFSNSGRDNEGFLPDVESTSQAVGFFKSTGMILHDEDFPVWFREEIVAFVKGLQESDGYFYHPQWDRATLAANTQRMGRDLNSSEGLLERFWSLPTYDTPNGMKGDGLLPDGTPVSTATPSSCNLTGRLSGLCGGVASAVSKVVPTSSIEGFEMLESVDSFYLYLDELAARNELPVSDSKYRSFYQIANEITTICSQITAKDEKNKKIFSDILVNWLNEHQNKETGLFDEGLSFANTNAYYKAINAYNHLECPVPLADKAIESSITILMNAEEFDCILNTFNIWGSINQTRINLEKYAKTADAIATRDAARKKLLELAPEAVRATADAQLLFKQSDGSFSYLIGNNTSVSQSMKVAVPNTCEGDVNSTTLTMGGILHGMLETMGIKGIAPTCFTEADGYRCMKRMSELGTIIKKDSSLSVEYIDFDAEELGSAPATSITYNLNGGSFTVVEAPRPNSTDNRAAMFDTALNYESLSVPTSSVTPNSSCYVFESDFCVPVDTEDGEIQILLQNAMYMTTINKVGDEVRVWGCRK